MLTTVKNWEFTVVKRKETVNNHWHTYCMFRWINISLVSSRCLFSVHTRLGWSQRRQCETLQDPQAWQWGILHHYPSAVWHITEACQTLYRYVVCKASGSSLIYYSSQSFLLEELFWKLNSVTLAALCHHAELPATDHPSATKGDD